jgi:cardiolipin synthase C
VRHRENEGARCYHPRPLDSPTLVHGPRADRCRPGTRHLWLLALLAWALTGCMSLPDVSQRPWDYALPPAPASPLVRLAAASVPAGELSGFRLVSSGAEALQLRLALIERAMRSLDLQAYQFKGDATGQALMRALRDAAARGVRVRLLLDDLYTAGDDALWLGLAAQPHIEVRLFNPFLAGRDSHSSRLLESALGSQRMQRRMHNKLLVADGALAVAGGRNIADAYFLPATQGSFVDIDVLVAGALLPQMAQSFDLYWNSDYSHELRSVAGEPLAAPKRQIAFTRTLASECVAPECDMVDHIVREATPLLREFDQGRVAMRLASASLAEDSPAKIDSDEVATDTVVLATSGAQARLLVEQAILQAQRELLIVSPYLIPGPAGAASLGMLRRRGVQVTMLTNSLAATDEPLVHLGYRKYRASLLREGVALYEWSPVRGGRVLRELLVGGTVLRLHAKAALIDRQVVYLGSMNFDRRSRDLNTEFALLIRSPDLAEELQALLQRLMREGAYRLHLDADGHTLHWSSGDSNLHAEEFEPDTDFGSRLLLDLLEPLVPEELL